MLTLERYPRRDAPHRVWIDYTCVGLQEDVLTVLCMREEESGAMQSIAVPEQGAAEYPVKAAVRTFEAWGLKRVILVADGDNAIQALLSAIKLARKEDALVTGKPRYDSKSKGLVENANQMVNGAHEDTHQCSGTSL